MSCNRVPARAGPRKGRRTVNAQLTALLQLSDALSQFLDGGDESEGSTGDDPRAGMTGDDLDCDSVDPGGEIHNAICAIQPFYGGKLPAPHPRNLWRELQRVCRREVDPYKRQNQAHELAGDLRKWVDREIKCAATDHEPSKLASLDIKRKRAGSPPRYNPEDDEKLEKDWKAAKSRGSRQKEFCASRGIKVGTLKAAQARIRERRSRPKK